MIGIQTDIQDRYGRLEAALVAMSDRQTRIDSVLSDMSEAIHFSGSRTDSTTLGLKNEVAELQQKLQAISEKAQSERKRERTETALQQEIALKSIRARMTMEPDAPGMPLVAFVHVYKFEDLVLSSGTSASVVTGPQWISTVEEYRRQDHLVRKRGEDFDEMFNGMIIGDPTFSTLIIPEDSSPMGIKSVLERMSADNGYDRGNITVQVSEVHDWPPGWTAPEHVSGTPKFFAYIFFHATAQTSPTAASELYNDLMGQGFQSTIATSAVGCMQWVRGCLPATNPSVHLADTYIKLISSKKPTTMMPIETPHPTATAETTESKRGKYGRNAQAEFGKVLPDMPTGASIAGYLLQLTKFFIDGAGAHAYADVLTEFTCITIVRTGVVQKIISSENGAIYNDALVAHESTVAFKQLCADLSRRLLATNQFPLASTITIPARLLQAMNRCLAELFALMRGLVRGLTGEEMLKFEARNQLMEQRSAFKSDKEWLVRMIPRFLGYVELWQDELADATVTAEMGTFLSVLLEGLRDAHTTTSCMQLAEDVMANYMRDHGLTKEQVMRRAASSERTRMHLSEQNALSAAMRNVPGTVGSVRFFNRPSDVNALHHLHLTIGYIRQLKTVVLGPTTLATTVDLRSDLNRNDVLHVEAGGAGNAATAAMTAETLMLGGPDGAPMPTPSGISNYFSQLRYPLSLQGTVADRTGNAPEPTAEMVKAITDGIGKCFTEFNNQQREYHAGLSDHLASLGKLTTQQLANIARHSDLGKATPSSVTPGTAGISLAHDVTGDVLAQGETTAGQRTLPGGTWSRDRERGDPRGMPAPRVRKPRLDKDGKIIVRLLDKPPIQWDEIREDVRGYLAGYGIDSEEAWRRKENEMCRFCGQDTDHYWSRCFRIFMTTEKGRKFLANSSRRNPVRSNATNSVVASYDDICAAWMCESFGIDAEHVDDDGYNWVHLMAEECNCQTERMIAQAFRAPSE